VTVWTNEIFLKLTALGPTPARPSCFETSGPPGRWQPFSSKRKFLQSAEQNFLRIMGRLQTEALSNVET
jgi:hypothetical protein